MRRVSLLGGSGQVGRAVLGCAAPGWTIVAPSSVDVDMRRVGSVRRAATDARADVIINCAAFTRVDDAEAGDAFVVNAEAPCVLAEASVEAGARLIHVSTDYVFDGTGTWSPPIRCRRHADRVGSGG